MSNPLFDVVFSSTEQSKRSFLFGKNYELSYADFHQRANQLATALIAFGLEAGERILIQTTKSSTSLALYMAVIKAGGIYVPLNTAYTPDEIEYFIENAGASLFIIDASMTQERQTIIEQMTQSHNAQLLTLSDDVIDGSNIIGSLNIAANQKPPHFLAVQRKPKDIAAILYTSGTTGKPKGAQLSHQNLITNMLALKQAWQFTQDDILLHMLPIFHAHGLFVACHLLAHVGGAMIFLPKFDVADTLAYIGKATSMMGVPPFYTRLLATPAFDSALVDHMRLFISGSAPLLAETHREFEARTGKHILERYGMTETGMITSNPIDGARIAGTVGLPLSGVTLRIADKHGNQIKAGEIGVIELCGDNVFSGYWQMPDANKAAFRNDGFFITGDLAYRDEQGYITIVGRDKDMIITGGLNVYPKEVETQIDKIKGVAESAVIAIPHADFGEAVAAIVVKDNLTLTKDTILLALQNHLAKFKHPKAVLFVDKLPRNIMGKVQKADLRQTYKCLFDKEQHHDRLKK